ncbi:MAG TPA: ABC transporter ATP-binding protein [Solirubrobacteraceae bacterium]|nr:ABC transporter ATP-binding protein [Solirubrobacteraceae bacterium]
MTEPILSVRDLNVSFRTEDETVRAVRGVSFDLAPGQVLGLVGESGSGKSTVAMALTALNRSRNSSFEGQVLYGGRDLLALSDSELRPVRGAQIAMIFQDPMTSLTPVHRVGSLITEVLRAHESISRRAARARAVELLSEVGIPDPARRADDFPHQFSGGMRQRVMIAMALACRPAVLIADEPTTALDVTIQAQIMRLIRRLQAEHGTAVILITHDLGVVAQSAETVAVMYAGRLVEQGTAREVFATPRHPYTRALLASIPRVDRPRTARLQAIDGQPPSMARADEGCAFAPRCPFAADVCRSLPGLEQRGPVGGHLDACLRSADLEAAGARARPEAGTAGAVVSEGAA